MIILASLALGVFLGLRAAKKRGGKRLDLLQYAAGYGIAFTLIGVMVTLVVERLAS